MDKGEREEALSQWLRDQLDLFHTPRRIDITREGQALGLSHRSIKRVLSTFPAYADVGRPVFPWPTKKHRNYRVHFFGTVFVDLAFFGKKASAELKALGAVSQTEQNPALVAIDGATHFAMAEPLGPGGKSTKAVLKAMDKIFERYKAQYNTYPYVLCSDREKAIMSTEMKRFLDEKGTRLYAYKFSRSKALFAENLIRILRASLSTLRKHRTVNGQPPVKWTRVLPSLIEDYNARPITHLGKKMSYAPIDITEKTFGAYKAEIRKKHKTYSFASFSIYPGLFKWKHPIGSRVRLKRRAVQVPGIGSNEGNKWSEQPLLEKYIFVVKRRAVHLNASNQLIKTLILQEETTGETTHQPEDACTLLKTPDPFTFGSAEEEDSS